MIKTFIVQIESIDTESTDVRYEFDTKYVCHVKELYDLPEEHTTFDTLGNPKDSIGEAFESALLSDLMN